MGFVANIDLWCKELVKDFVSRNKGYCIVLSRINGSAVESLFSQLKYSVAGKLTSINYGAARAAVMVKSNCQSPISCLTESCRDHSL
jgi:hypothetical protein